jgi:hypothetical protein
MPDTPDSKSRAETLRDRIARQKRQAEERSRPVEESGPRPGESPHAFVERRMRETLKKKDPETGEEGA